jgi:hypothetical protein
MADKFKDIQKIIDKNRELKPLLEAENKLLLEYYAIQEEIGDSDEKRLERAVDRVAEADKELKLAEQLADMGEKLEGHYDAIYKKEEEGLKLREEKLAQSKKEEGFNQKIYDGKLKQLKLDQDSLKARKDAAGYTEGLIARLTGITDKPTSGIAKMFSNPEGFSKGFKDGIGKMITPMNIMTSTIDKVVETTMALAIEQDAAISGFRKAAGATGAFDDDIIKLEKNLRMAGVTSAEAAESVQELYVNVSGFTEMGSEARKEMAGMVAVLSEVGVAAADSTKNIQLAIKGLGMSKTEATMLQSELRSFAQGINVSTGQMSKDFATMGPQIVAMGDKGVDAFKNLQVTMKETGLEMSTMLKIVGQFDTFDSAGKQVGKLNALLGGPFLNTLDLVSETDLGARMEKLRDGVMAAGLSFDEMDYYQKKAYTSALGLNSEMELAMFLGNNMDSIIPDEKTAEEYEEIAKQTSQFNSVMDELRQMMMVFAISMRPAVELIKGFFETIQKYAPLIKGLIATIVTLRTVTTLMTIAQTANAYATRFQGKAAFKGIAITKAQIFWRMLSKKATDLFSGSIALNTLAGKANMKVWGLVAAALLTIFTIIFIGSSPSLIAVVGFLTIAMFGLAYASNVLGWSVAPILPVLAVFGATILMIGLGIGIAAAGMALFVSSVNAIGTGLAASMLATAMAIREIVDAIDDVPMTKTLALTAAVLPLAAMAPVAALASAGMGAVTRGLGGGAESGGAAGASGPPAVIKVYLDVGGDKFAVAVNNVEVKSKLTSKLHQTFVDQLEDALLAKP